MTAVFEDELEAAPSRIMDIYCACSKAAVFALRLV